MAYDETNMADWIRNRAQEDMRSMFFVRFSNAVRAANRAAQTDHWSFSVRATGNRFGIYMGAYEDALYVALATPRVWKMKEE